MDNEIKYRMEVSMLLYMEDDNGEKFDFPLICNAMVDHPGTQEQINKAAGDAIVEKVKDLLGRANHDMEYIKRETEKIKNDPHNQLMLMHLYEREDKDGVEV